MEEPNNRITLRSLILGALISGLFAYLTVYFENRTRIILTATQIPVLPYVLLFLSVLFINPFCRLLGFVPFLRAARALRSFSLAEMLIIFVMGSVSSGISTFGLASQIVPVMGNLFNRHWNSEQTKWDIYIEPFMNESFFLSEPGIQEKALAHRKALLRYEELDQVHAIARHLDESVAAVGEAQAKLHAASSSGGPDATRTIKENRARSALRYAEKALAQAKEAWAPFHETHRYKEVLVVFPARVEQARADLEAARETLRELEEKAFDKVEVFRRGLKHKDKTLRAIPGILPQPSESIGMYLSRFRRLRQGLKAAHPLRELKLSLEAGGGARLAGEVEQAMKAAAEALRPVSDRSELQKQKDALDHDSEGLSKTIEEKSKALREKSQERRLAKADQFAVLDNEIAALNKETAGLKERIAEVGLELEKTRKELEFAVRVGDTIKKLEELQAFAAGGEPDAEEARKKTEAILAEFPTFDGTLRRFLVGDTPWGEWLKPLFNWGMVILLTYVILMTFNVLIFRQWAHNEKLIYPLAELPEMLAGHEPDGKAAGAIPPLFRSGLFWAGVAIVGVILGYNLFAKTEIVKGLKQISLTFSWRPYVENSIFSALIQQRLHIFFTMVGLSFLIPAKISFSLWFFYLLYIVQLQFMCWAGHGVHEGSFPAMWWDTANFKTAEGGGALFVFAGVILYKCRRFLLCFFAPSSVRDLDADERTELRVSSLLFVASSIGLILFLWLRLGANVFYTIFCYFAVIVITIGLIRAVTEGGILGFQCWCGPFHIIRSVFGMDKTWTSPTLFGPLMVYYSLMFLDIKTFIAPAMANSIKIRDDLRMSRMRFHLAIFLGIGVAAVVAVLSQIILCYSGGADGMNRWFHTSFPDRWMFGKIVSMTKNRPIDTTGGAFWLGFGGVAMGLLLYFRQFIFWLPHPIGMIMLTNPIMRTYWFSIFLGWLFKNLITKYGNKDTYKNLRFMFVGLIVGELIIIVLAMIVTMWTGKPIGIDLNRN